MKKLKLMMAIAISVFFMVGVESHAEQPKSESVEQPMVINRNDFKNETLFSQAVNKALNNPDIEHCIVINEQENFNGFDNQSESHYFLDSVYDNPIYKVDDFKTLPDSYGADEDQIGEMRGAPGITIGLSHSKSITYQINAGITFGASEKLVFDAGWHGASSSTITYTGTWKVPSTHNGRAVLRGVLHMRPVYENKSYNVYYRMYGTSNWNYKGSSKTQKVVAADIYKTYIYKLEGM